MVSRGGRSKGCTQCRRRKVKCDETRPACIRCLKRGVDCDGPRDLQWIHQDLPVPASPSPGTEVASMNPPNELSINAYENSICYTYTRTTLFRGGPVELACNMIDLTDDNMFSHNPELGMLRDAIMSLSTTYFGNRHRDQRIVAKGYNQYGQVLKQLNTALAMPACQMSNEILLTAFTCMLVEMFSPKGPINFLKHQRGIEAMMRLRGPPNDATGETAIMFRGLRVMSIVSALVDQRPSIYASEPWSNAPIPQTTGTGRLQHDLLTVLASCTQLTTDRNALLTSGLDGECRINLLERADGAMAEVEALYPVWVATNEKELTKAEKSSYLVQDLAIANHLSATAYMLYHAIRICIFQIKQSLECTSSYVELRNDAALKIARCLELKERERQEGLAPLSTTWSSIAIKVVWQALGGFETEGEQRLYRAVECISIWLARST